MPGGSAGLPIVALVYTAIALGVYWTALSAPLLSDDFYFLGIVAPASSALVVFEPLVGRFVRPIVVGMYYLGFHIGGLAPLPYHLLTLLPHVLTACLIYAAAYRLAGAEEKTWAFLAGLLFLVFGGHSEAVSWPAGLADPALAAALMSAFVCYLRALQPSASRYWLPGFFAALLVATQAKEAWVMFPGVLIAHALAFGLPDRFARRRAAIAIGGAAACVFAYLLMRRLVFGSVTGGFTGLASSFQPGVWSGQMRAFLLRAFVPAGSFVANSWINSRDLLIWPVALVVLAIAARGRSLRMILFAAMATFAALVPVLPLTISVSSTESERFVYVATVFSSILVVWSIKAAVRIRPAALAICLAIIVAHAAALVKINRVWHAAGTLAASIIDSFADEVMRHDPDARASIFILNLADNIGGPFVFRTGFYPAIRIGRPEVAARTPGTVGIATTTMKSPNDATRVLRTGARSFSVDFGSNTIVQATIPSTFQFTIANETRTSYDIEFSEAIDRSVVLYLSEGRLQYAGAVEGIGAPFGVVDLPAAAASCDGASLRFAGWALDNDAVSRVSLRSEDGREVGAGVPRAGMRPDVAAKFPSFPNVDEAGWDFELPCDAVRRSPGAAMLVRVVVRDKDGLERPIGERRVTSR